MKNYLSLLFRTLLITALAVVCNQSVFAQGGAKWATGGNAASGNDFLGTTNAFAIIFKTNNIERGSFSATGSFTLNSLSGTGAGLVQTDASRLLSRLNFSGNANEVLYGNGIWGTIPQLSHWTQNGNNIYYNHGFVGIGTNNPMWDLDVIGDVRISNNLYVGGGIVITEKVQANVKVNTASLEADSIIMDSTKAFYGYSNFKDAVRLDNKLDVQGNVSVTGNLKSTGNTQVDGSFVLGSITGSNGLAYIDSTGTLKVISGTISPQPGGTLPNFNIPDLWSTWGNDDINSTHYLGTINNAALIIKTNSTERMRITETGNVGIGTITPTAKLTISLDDNNNSALSIFSSVDNKDNFRVKGNGNVYARDIFVYEPTVAFPDYVFDLNYKKLSLEELEKYITKNKHLPNLLSAEEIKSQGSLSLGDMNNKAFEKIEELTLYIIELNKKLENIQKQNDLLQKQIEIIQNK